MRRLPIVLVLLLISDPARADARQDCHHHLSIDACTELVRQNPKDAAAYLHRGHAYLSKGEYGQAHADYIKAMELGGLYDDTLLFDTDKFSGYDRSTSKAWPTQEER
jgi:tetratricopeptide (TPR) repeat protein